MTQEFKAQVRYQSGIAIIDLYGELTALANNALNATYAEAESQTSARVLLNFSGVRYINSSGIGLIIGLIGRSQRSNCSLGAYGLNPGSMEIFKIIGLTGLITIVPDEASALALAPVSA